MAPFLLNHLEKYGKDLWPSLPNKTKQVKQIIKKKLPYKTTHLGFLITNVGPEKKRYITRKIPGG